MASPAQILANHENARKSTGPKTESGKQTSRRNATRHGLTGTQIVIPGEDASAYEELRQGLHDSYKPANDPEQFLVEQVAANAWRLARAQRVEAAFLAKLAEDSDDPIASIAAAFLERPAEMAKVQRYVTTAQNAYYKAMNELAKLQNARAQSEHEAAMTEALFASRTGAPPIGFVSQSQFADPGFTASPVPIEPGSSSTQRAHTHLT